MHIAIPFDIETVKQSWGQAGRMWGRVIGNHTFLVALAGNPECRRLTLLVPSRHDVELLRRTLLPEFGPAQAKVAIVPFVTVTASLKEDPPDLIHMLDPNLWFAAHIRAQLAPRWFPVTGVTHSLGNQHFLEWALLNNANGVSGHDGLVCTTPTAQDVVQAVFRRLGAGQPGFRTPRTTVIPLGIQVGRFAGSRVESRASLGLPGDGFIVLSLGRFNPQFKMDLVPLLRLAALVATRMKRPVKFIIAGSSGDGDYLRFLRDRSRAEGVESVVEFVADPDEPRKLHLLRAANAFVSLSDNIQETFGLTPIEAMAAGTPVVASDWDGYRSLIRHGVSGFLVPTRTLAPDAAWEAALAMRYDSLVHLFSAQATAVDLDVACEYLLGLAGDPALAQRVAEAGLEQVRRFDWGVVIGQYMELWRGMLSEAGSAQRGAPETVPSSALRFLEDFSGYATAALAPEDCFRATPAGQMFRDGSSVMLYFETDEFLDRRVMAAIVGHCSDTRSVAQLAGLLKDQVPGGARQLGQNILWLYKYGYIRAVRS